jgi:hypothetical protein
MCATLDMTVPDPLTGKAQEVAPSHCESAQGITGYGLVGAGTVAAGPTNGPIYLAWGLVPNGNKTVTANLASGASQALSVSDNAFLARLPSQVESIVFIKPGGSSVTVPTGPN